MVYDFDSVVDRKNTDCSKHDFAVRHGKPSDLIPLWVADMDFKSPNEVVAEIVRRANHGVYGYSDSGESYSQAVVNWFKTQYGWSVDPSCIVKAPSVVVAISLAIQALTEPHEGVLIQTPVYYPFYHCIENNHRQLVCNPLLYKGGKYEIDFVDFEDKIVNQKVKLFILCNPHNPVGRVWTAHELGRMLTICRENDVAIVADEIHADFVYSPHRHTVLANLPPYYNNIVTCTSPSKTFNLAGLQLANIIISNSEYKKKFFQAMGTFGYSQPNSFSFGACEAAYNYGEDWLIQLREYLVGNIQFVRTFLEENLPKVKLVEPEGTYLLWLDFSAFELEDEKLNQIIEHDAKLWLSAGSTFGADGKGFQRMNIATQRSVLKTALLQLHAAFKKY